MAETITVHNPQSLKADTWLALRQLALGAFTASLQDRRSPAEIAQLVGGNSDAAAQAWIDSHVDPNRLVGKEYSPNQAFWKPRIAVATGEDGQPVGYAYAAHNVSGASALQRAVKRAEPKPVHRYLWLREFAVAPKERERGVALQLGAALLEGVRPDQPVSAYVWPDELPEVYEALTRHGFRPTGASEAQIYGPDSTPVQQVRMQALAGEALAAMPPAIA